MFKPDHHSLQILHNAILHCKILIACNPFLSAALPPLCHKYVGYFKSHCNIIFPNLPLDDAEVQEQRSKSRMNVSLLEQRCYVKVAVLRGRNATQCHSELVLALGSHALPNRTVARWIAAFQHGREASADLQRSGCPVHRKIGAGLWRS
jgi:hypothetical protein